MKAAELHAFRSRLAPEMRRRLGGDLEPEHHKSTRFAYLADNNRLVVLVPATDRDPDWALAYGLAERDGRQLHLVLPRDSAFATLQRTPWLREAARPVLWLHENGSVHPAKRVDRDTTIENVSRWAGKQTGVTDPAGEFAKATTPIYLGDAGQRIGRLVDWATEQAQLDASHRQGSRSWQCAGQAVLSIQPTQGGGINIRAGIHDSELRQKPTLFLPKGSPLTDDQLHNLQTSVLAAVASRLQEGGTYHKPDEHWLQSVIRRYPALVGLESAALREVPAWRPRGPHGTFGRGLLDLMGIDGHGDIRLVEAKLAKSSDDMTLLQGLDYYIWARAYKDVLRDKLSAPKKAQLRLHYVIGAVGGDQRLLPTRIAQYADALDTDAVPYQFHVVQGWHTHTPDPRLSMTTQPSPPCTLPALEAP